MDTAKQQDPWKITGKNCPTALAVYAFVWEPRKNKDPNKPSKYQITLLWPEGTDLTVITAAIRAGAARKWGTALPSGLKNPLRRGNVARKNEITGEVDPLFKDRWFLTARSKDKPPIVNAVKLPIVNQMDFYSGCTCKVALSFGGYDAEGSKGVAAYLGPIQKIADGERLAGHRDPDTEFDEEGDAPSHSGPADDPFADPLLG